MFCLVNFRTSESSSAALCCPLRRCALQWLPQAVRNMRNRGNARMGRRAAIGLSAQQPFQTNSWVMNLYSCLKNHFQIKPHQNSNSYPVTDGMDPHGFVLKPCARIYLANCSGSGLTSPKRASQCWKFLRCDTRSTAPRWSSCIRPENTTWRSDYLWNQAKKLSAFK